MPVNDKIRTVDYNDIRNQVINILGTGSGNSGYGQSVRSSAVTDATRVSVNEWGNLYYDILNCYVHQTGSAPASPTSAVEGNIVKHSTDATVVTAVCSGTTIWVYSVASGMVAVGQTVSGSGIVGTPVITGPAAGSMPSITITSFGTKTGTGPYLVTFNHAAEPVALTVNDQYTISGNSNALYNGKFKITASTTTSTTFQYPVDPGTYGSGTTLIVSPTDPNPWGRGAWTISVANSLAVRTLNLENTTTTHPNTQYNTFAGVITSSKFSIAGSQSFTTSKGSGSQTWPGVYGSYWVSRIQSLITVGFTTADKARGFFNSGCEIRFTSSRSGGTASPTNTANVGWRQNESWTNFLATVAPRFGGNLPNTGIDPNDGSNFYRLSNAFVTPFYNVSASSPYGSNSFKVWARTPDIADNSNGGATTIQFLVEWVDAYTDPVPGGGLPASSFPPGDGVDGTITLACSTLEATGVLQPVGTGNFTVESPTVSIGTITT
jgi:hypothetical protein